MASVLVCDICGAPDTPGEVPPRLWPCAFQTPLADFDILLCPDHRATATAADIIKYGTPKPGGTVEGADRVPFMVE